MMIMKSFQAASLLGLLAVLGSAAVPQQARADMLPACPDMRCQTYFFLGGDSESFALNLNSSGTMTVSLEDAKQSLPNFAPLSSLSFMVASGTQVLWSSLSAASQSFTLPAGTYTGLLNATAADPNTYGVLSLDIKFAPDVVPLPAAFWLLLSGGLAVVGLTRIFNKTGRITVPETAAATTG